MTNASPPSGGNGSKGWGEERGFRAIVGNDH
jgi:hypothetical protein